MIYTVAILSIVCNVILLLAVARLSLQQQALKQTIDDQREYMSGMRLQIVELIKKLNEVAE